MNAGTAAIEMPGAVDGHEAPGHARRCLSQCPPTVKR